MAIYTACIGILECDVTAGIECAHPYSAPEACVSYRTTPMRLFTKYLDPVKVRVAVYC